MVMDVSASLVTLKKLLENDLISIEDIVSQNALKWVVFAPPTLAKGW